jgi:hypothetical protein
MAAKASFLGVLPFGRFWASYPQKGFEIYKILQKYNVFARNVCYFQHELHLWIYYMSKFLNTSEFIIMINSRHILNLS